MGALIDGQEAHCNWITRPCFSATPRTADLFGCLRRDRPENTDPTKRFPTSLGGPQHAGLVGMRCARP